MKSRSGIESAFIPRSWRGFVQPRLGRQFLAWRRQPQGIPNEATIILSPRGGGRGNRRQPCCSCRVASADRNSQVSALGVGLPSGAPFRCKHRIMHRKGGPGQRGPQYTGFGVGRGFAIWGPFPVQAPDNARETWTWSTRSEGGRQLAGPHPRRKPGRVEVPNMCWTCGSLISCGCKTFGGNCDCLLEFTSRTELSLGAARESGHNSMCHNGLRVLLRATVRDRPRELVVRCLRHLPRGSRRQAMGFRRSATGKSRCKTQLPSGGPELLPEWRAF